jgi:hypothetical protein
MEEIKMEYKGSVKSDQGTVTFTITDENAASGKTVTIGGDTLTIKIVTAPAGAEERE